MTRQSWFDAASDGLAWAALLPFFVLAIALLPVFFILALIGKATRAFDFERKLERILDRLL